MPKNDQGKTYEEKIQILKSSLGSIKPQIVYHTIARVLEDKESSNTKEAFDKK